MAQDISELKKVVGALGAVVAVVKVAAQKKGVPAILGTVLAKAPYLQPLAEMKVSELLPEVVDVDAAEAKELIDHLFKAAA